MTQAQAQATATRALGDRQLAGTGVRLLTPAQAGEQLGASESHLYRLIASGALRAVNIAQPGAHRSKTRIRSDDLEQYIESLTRDSPPATRDGGGPRRQAQRRPRRSQNTPNTHSSAGGIRDASQP